MSELQFDGQRDGEEVKFIFRRHIATASKGLWWLVLCLAAGVAPLFLWSAQRGTMLLVFLGAAAVGLLGALYTHMLWYFSIYIVTDQRIRQISQKGLFKKGVIDLGLDKIQSISCQLPGFFGGFFNYGTILIQTAVGDLTISKTSNPEKIYNKLQNLIGKVGQNEEA